MLTSGRYTSFDGFLVAVIEPRLARIGFNWCNDRTRVFEIYNGKVIMNFVYNFVS